MPGHVGFVVDKTALGQVPPANHSTDSSTLIIIIIIIKAGTIGQMVADLPHPTPRGEGYSRCPILAFHGLSHPSAAGRSLFTAGALPHFRNQVKPHNYLEILRANMKGEGGT
jgi:hypothetical protein